MKLAAEGSVINMAYPVLFILPGQKNCSKVITEEENSFNKTPMGSSYNSTKTNKKALPSGRDLLGYFNPKSN